MNETMKKTFRRVLAGAFALSMAFSASGCGKKDKLHITVIAKKPTGSYWEAIKKGAMDAGEEMGIEISYIAPENETLIDDQKQLVIDAAAKKTDAIVLSPCSATELDDAINSVYAKGIPVITIDSDAPGSERKCCISTLNRTAGSIAARATSEFVSITKGDVAIIGNTASATTVIDRIGGFTEQIKISEPELNILEPEYCDGDKEKAQRIASELIQSNSNLKVIFCTTESSTLGASAAIAEAGCADSVQLIGFDCSDPVVGYIRDGVVDATIVQNPYNMGYLGVRNAYKAHNKEAVTPVLDTGATLVTLDNLDDADIQFLINPLAE